VALSIQWILSDEFFDAEKRYSGSMVLYRSIALKRRQRENPASGPDFWGYKGISIQYRLRRENAGVRL
jgi:hypothetical protein